MTQPPRALLELLSIARDAQCLEQFETADAILHQAIREYALTELPIEVLCPMTVRIAYALCNADVDTLDKLLRRRPADLRRWKNFGQISLSRLGIRLRALGLNLAEQHDYAWIRPLPTRSRERSVLIPSAEAWTWTDSPLIRPAVVVSL
jgi:Bacterial RNA polymerase, alpha chain C terminal domain